MKTSSKASKNISPFRIFQEEMYNTCKNLKLSERRQERLNIGFEQDALTFSVPCPNNVLFYSENLNSKQFKA